MSESLVRLPLWKFAACWINSNLNVSQKQSRKEEAYVYVKAKRDVHIEQVALSDMELLPGVYSIEIVFRDRLSGKIAAKKKELVLPALNSEFSMSGVALSRFVEPIKKTPAAAETVDVFSQGGVRIRPLPSREFRATDNLVVLFELYNASVNSETGKPMVWVRLKLMKDDQPATKPMDYLLTETVVTPSQHLTFAKYIKLAGLQAGKYVAIIEARDRGTQKLLTRQESFVIAP